MTDFSKIYFFLGSRKNWVSEADMEFKDGNITKKEFRTFMLNNISAWNGESTVNANSMINEFWNSVDVNRSGLCAGSNSVRNQNALDSKEIEKLTKKIEVYEEFQSFRNKYVLNSIPDVNDKLQWVNSVSEGLTLYVDKYIENPTQGSLEQMLLTVLDDIKTKTTANLFAQEYLLEVQDDIASVVFNYNRCEEMQRIISAFVLSLKNDENYQGAEDKEGYIKDLAKKIIDQYLATAGIGEKNDIDLTKYGYIQSNKLNELQTQVVTKSITDKITDYLQMNEEDYQSNKEIYLLYVAKFVELTVANATQDDFTTLKDNFDINEFLNSDCYTNIAKKIQELKDKTAASNNNTSAANSEQTSTNTAQTSTNTVQTSTNTVQNAVEALSGIVSNPSFKEDLMQYLTVQDKSAITLSCDSISIDVYAFRDAQGFRGHLPSVFYGLTDKLKSTLQFSLPDAYNKLGSETIDRLVEAAWIATAMQYPVRSEVDEAEVLKKSLYNLEGILKAIQKNPAYLSIITGANPQSYAALTSNLGCNFKVTDYNSIAPTYAQLLENLKAYYSELDADIVTSIFNQSISRTVTGDSDLIIETTLNKFYALLCENIANSGKY